MAGYRLYNSGSINLNLGPGPAAAHDDNFYYDSLQDPNQYSINSTWGQYRGEWQLLYSIYGANDHSSSWFQRGIQIANSSGYDIFIPSNSSAENKSVFYHVKESSGVSTTQGVYGNSSTGYTNNSNALPRLWYENNTAELRAYQSAAGDTYGGGGIHCWQNNGDWNYYGASATQPNDCPSGFSNSGVYSGFYYGNNMETVTTYDNSGNYYSYGQYIDSRGYGWDSFYSGYASSYPWCFIYPSWFGSATYGKHDQTVFGQTDIAIYGNGMPYFGWSWLHAMGVNGYGSQPFGCSSSYPYFAGAVRICRKYANNSYTSV
jgi:hypothetical protein